MDENLEQESVNLGQQTDTMNLLDLANEYSKTNPVLADLQTNSLLITTKGLKITPILNSAQHFNCSLTVQLNGFVVKELEKQLETNSLLKENFKSIDIRSKYTYNNLYPVTFNWEIGSKDDISSIFETIILTMYFVGIAKNYKPMEGVALYKDRDIEVKSEFMEKFENNVLNLVQENNIKNH